MAEKKALVLGATGMVGKALMSSLSKFADIKTIGAGGRGFGGWDIRDQEATRQDILKIRPSVIFLAAYITNVDACQDRSTDSTNMDGCFNIVSVAEDIGARVVFFSSSYVFRGDKGSPYNLQDGASPINHYGAQKLAVEDYINLVCKNHVIVRTVGVFGPDYRAKSFPHQIIRAAQGGQKILVAEDQWMTPCHSDFLASLVSRIALRSDFRGTLHISGDKSVTKYQFAKDILRQAGLDAEIFPIDSGTLKQVAKRPKMGSLDSSYIAQAFPNVSVPSYEESLRRFDQYG